jgi:hypothetical protein
VKIEKRLLVLHELGKLATKAGTLTRQASEEQRAYRIAGRLARDPEDRGARCEALVEAVKRGDVLFLELTKELGGWLWLQLAMVQVSYAMWEKIWDNAHPERFGRAWDGEDLDLMTVWREQVRALIKACHQEAILAITAEGYSAQLIEAGASEEDAEALAEWISMINE